MNLLSLYDLKERLEHAAIAGTSLLQEDFRLRRAVEALAPLAKANPVFAKISAGALALLNAPETERSTKLLDVLSLVDAVVYTQGATSISGEMIPAEQGTGRYVQASYGQLQQLLTALKGSGSGRTSIIRECWISHPDYFTDFRVLPYVVSALGDNYGELVDLIAEILMKQGASVIPHLKENFDPAGKMEMARRVRLVAKLAGEEENDWFVRILPESKKDVREAVIQALSLSKENHQLLLDLCQSERGKLKDAAMRSLAAMCEDTCVDYLSKEVEKKPNTVWCLAGLDTRWTADMTAFAIKKFLASLLDKPSGFDYTKQEYLVQYCCALSGKYSDNIRGLWIWISENISGFSEICAQGRAESVAEYLQHCFMSSILSNPCSQMLELAGELCERQPFWFLCGQFLADLISCSPEDVYDRYAKHFVHENLLVKENERQKNARVQLMMIFSFVTWKEKYGRYTLPSITADRVSGKILLQDQLIPGLDRRWIEHLASHNIVQECSLCAFHPKLLLVARQSTVERILMNLIDPNDTQMCQLCGTYYHRRARMTGQFAEYLDVLIKCGWKNWSGLLAHCIQKQTQVRLYQVLELLKRLPVSNLEKANELRQVDALVKAGRISVWNRIWPEEQIAMLLLQLESDPNAEL